MRKITFLLIIALFTVACKKETTDLRTSYEGNWLFSIHKKYGDVNYGNYIDTTYSATGFVKKVGDVHDSLLEIHYGTDTIFNGIDHGTVKIVTEHSSLKISMSKTLSYPGGFGEYGNTYLIGKFDDNNHLEMTVSIGGLGYWNLREITGSKK